MGELWDEFVFMLKFIVVPAFVFVFGVFIFLPKLLDRVASEVESPVAYRDKEVRDLPEAQKIVARPTQRKRTHTSVKRVASAGSFREVGGRLEIQMRRKRNCFIVPMVINGVELNFILDTGADDITLSLSDRNRLYAADALSDDDVVGGRNYVVANGTVERCPIYSVEYATLGNRTVEGVQVSVMDGNMSLLGGAFLRHLGRVTVDYDRCVLIIE